MKKQLLVVSLMVSSMMSGMKMESKTISVPKLSKKQCYKVCAAGLLSGSCCSFLTCYVLSNLGMPNRVIISTGGLVFAYSSSFVGNIYGACLSKKKQN